MAAACESVAAGTRHNADGAARDSADGATRDSADGATRGNAAADTPRNTAIEGKHPKHAVTWAVPRVVVE